MAPKERNSYLFKFFNKLLELGLYLQYVSSIFEMVCLNVGSHPSLTLRINFPSFLSKRDVIYGQPLHNEFVA